MFNLTGIVEKLENAGRMILITIYAKRAKEMLIEYVRYFSIYIIINKYQLFLH